MDERSLIDTMQKISCNLLIHDAIIWLYKSKDISFIGGFKYTMKERTFIRKENDMFLALLRMKFY